MAVRGVVAILPSTRAGMSIEDSGSTRILARLLAFPLPGVSSMSRNKSRGNLMNRDNNKAELQQKPNSI